MLSSALPTVKVGEDKGEDNVEEELEDEASFDQGETWANHALRSILIEIARGTLSSAGDNGSVETANKEELPRRIDPAERWSCNLQVEQH